MSKIMSVLGDGEVHIGRRKVKDTLVKIKPAASVTTARKKALQGVGCANCPLDKSRRAVKLKNLHNVKGRRIMIWGVAPNVQDTQLQKVFGGTPGTWLWNELRAIGIDRADCDVQYVCRCRPTGEDPVSGAWVDRPPTKEELHACSIYTADALARNKGKANVHLVFGQVAASALLGREYKKNVPTFWSEKLNAKVCVLAHPSYFLRGGQNARLKEWRTSLASAVDTSRLSSKYAYLEAQDYRLVKTARHAKQVVRKILKYNRKERISVDIEYGWVDRKGNPCESGTGRQVILVIGVSTEPGVSRVFVVDHPEATASRSERDKIVKVLGKVLSNPKIKKIMHHGTADVKPIQNLLDIPVAGYDFDTNYSTYLQWPQQKRYGLEEMSVSRVPEFTGYKDIVKPYVLETKPNYATIPLKVMRLYNGADCDITKRLEALTKKQDGPLLRTYTKVAFVLDEMQKRGPCFDSRYYDEVVSLVPRRLAKVKKTLVKLAGNKDINLNAPKQVQEVLYNKLRFKTPEGYPPMTTQAEVMRIFSQHKTKGEFPKGLIEYRELSKMEGTYLSNYRESAALNDGELRTIWWLTGTITGRLRSGGKDRGQQGIINFQNLHGDPMLQNLLISDPRWRRALLVWERRGSGFNELWKIYHEKISQLRCFLAFDYGQIEIRMAAEMSEDPLLLAAVESGDIHTAVGYELTGWDKDKIKNDKETRTLIKNLHFGILYGMSKRSLFQFLIGLGIKISEERSNELHTKYFRKYKKVRQLIDHLQAFAEKHNYVETLFGFRRPLNTAGDDDGRSTFWGNQAINSPIQGSAHQLMLFAMATLHEQPQKYKLLQTPVMEVHDALDFYVKLKYLPDALAEGLELFQTAVPAYVKKHFGRTLKVPLVAEGAAGFRLGVMEKYNGGSTAAFTKAWLKKNDEVEKKITAKWGKAA